MKAPKPEEIRRQVEIICLSAPLDRARRRRSMFRYMVEATLAGTRATEKDIAVNVYGKDATTFDPALDTIVRVEKQKLRTSLDEFYNGPDGRKAPIRISIKKYAVGAQYANRSQRAQAAAKQAAYPHQRLPENSFYADLSEQCVLALPGKIVEWLATIETFFLEPRTQGEVIVLAPITRYRWSPPPDGEESSQEDIAFRNKVEIPQARQGYIPITLEKSHLSAIGVGTKFRRATTAYRTVEVQIPFHMLSKAGIDPPSNALHVWRDDANVYVAAEESWIARGRP